MSMKKGYKCKEGGYLFSSSDSVGFPNLSRILQAFVKRHKTPIEDDWSNVSLNTFNKFMEDIGYMALDRLVTELLYEGITIDDMASTAVKFKQ